MMKNNKQEIVQILKGFPLSYAQILFSNNLWLGILLFLISFADLGIGLSGVIAIGICQFSALFFQFEQTEIKSGVYTYNALMFGLAMGSLYQFSNHFFLILIIGSVFTFFLTIFFHSYFSLKRLPMLSLPFLVSIWTMFLALSNFKGFQLEAKELYTFQHYFPALFSSISSIIDTFLFRDFIHLYLRSLSAIFFQYSDLLGCLIAIGLLFQSRISLALSLYGFLIGYLFYNILDGDFSPLVYSYIGFNFILSAISLGGFFIVPSLKSHLLLLIAIPLNALLISSFHTLFSNINLPLYSLPFNAVVILILSVLQKRYWSGDLKLVQIQQFSPEQNHYKTLQFEKRFKGQTYLPISLPFMGEWHIAQGHNGELTHKQGWQHAWDFDQLNEFGDTYNYSGTELNHYLCYELPVVAPAHGWVVTVVDGVADNPINEVNLNQNWGNTIIIKHGERLYSKLSHLKPYSIKVKEGDYVRAGEIIGLCGSSGRSPEPHLHFQIQANPYIGSETIRYPLNHFLVKKGERYTYCSFEYPKQNQIVRNVITNPLLANAFNFIAGREVLWEIDQNGNLQQEKWLAQVDIYNKQYLYCETTESYAYFYSDGVMFYFTDFYGNKSSFLYKFYLICQKVFLAFYEGVLIEDYITHELFFNSFLCYTHDFIAPFFHFLKGNYVMRSEELYDQSQDQMMKISTELCGFAFGKTWGTIKGEVFVNYNGFHMIYIKSNSGETKAKCIGY